jgi:hypothetical protein
MKLVMTINDGEKSVEVGTLDLNAIFGCYMEIETKAVRSNWKLPPEDVKKAVPQQTAKIPYEKPQSAPSTNLISLERFCEGKDIDIVAFNRYLRNQNVIPVIRREPYGFFRISELENSAKNLPKILTPQNSPKVQKTVNAKGETPEKITIEQFCRNYGNVKKCVQLWAFRKGVKSCGQTATVNSNRPTNLYNLSDLLPYNNRLKKERKKK